MFSKQSMKDLKIRGKKEENRRAEGDRNSFCGSCSGCGCLKREQGSEGLLEDTEDRPCAEPHRLPRAGCAP